MRSPPQSTVAVCPRRRRWERWRTIVGKAVEKAWPYWTEFVQSMTCRMGLPSLTVPRYEEQAFELTADDGPERRG